MGKLMLTAIAVSLSLAGTAAYAQTAKQEPVRVAQTDTKEKPKRSKTTDAKNVDDANPAGGPTEGKERRASGKQRKQGPDAKSVDENRPSK